MSTPPTRPRRFLPYLEIAPGWLVLGLFVVVPLAMMAAISLCKRGVYGGIRPIEDLAAYAASGRWLANYARAGEPIFLAIYWRSTWLAGVTTALCLLVAFPIAYYLAVVVPPRRRNLLLGLVAVPFWTSFLIRTYAWMLVLRGEGLLNTLLVASGLVQQPLDLLYNDFAVLLGLVYGELPFMILPLYVALERLDLSLLEAATDLGAGPAQGFWRITVPLTLPGIVAGVVLVFIPSLGQFIVSDLLGGARTILVGNLIQNQFAVARDKPFGSAVAFALTAVVLALLFALSRYSQRHRAESLL